VNLYTQLVSSWLFPLHERIKGHTTTSVRRQLESSQWLSPADLQARQITDLRRFLQNASNEVPYYRQLFQDLGFKPSSIKCLGDLRRLPLLDKETIRANTKLMTREGAGGLKRFNTGGSSGEPLIFFLGKERVSHDVAAKWRAMRWWNVDIGDPEVVIWGSPIELGAQDMVRRLRDHVFRTDLVPAFEISKKNMSRFLRRIRARRPRMLFGYPSSMAMLAEHAMASNFRMDDLGIRVAFVTSESLYPHQREAIEAAFGCTVANGYGGRDAGFIAHACPAGSLHITAEDIVVELVARDGSSSPTGEPGEIVITHLRTRDFPFIRYRTGDVGVLSDRPCECGRGLPILEKLEGRSTDFVVAEDGTVMHGLALIYVLREISEISQFRIVQESIYKTCAEVVVREGYDQSTESRIVDGLRSRLGRNVTVEVIKKDSLDRESSGKFRYVKSKVFAT